MPDRTPQEHPGEEPAKDPSGHPGNHSGDPGDDPVDDTVDAGVDDDVANVDVPLPRPPLDDLSVIGPPAEDSGNVLPDSDVLPENGLVEPVWRYDQEWTRGKRRRYNGYVQRVGGVEGQRLRESLAAAIRDLLDWAAQHAHNNPDKQAENDLGNNPGSAGGDGDSDGGSGTDSSMDGGADDTPA